MLERITSSPGSRSIHGETSAARHLSPSLPLLLRRAGAWRAGLAVKSPAGGTWHLARHQTRHMLRASAFQPCADVCTHLHVTEKTQAAMANAAGGTMWWIRLKPYPCIAEKHVFCHKNILKISIRFYPWMFEKEFCLQRVRELTSVNMQLDSFEKRVLFTDQCSVSFGAITLSHFLSISPRCYNQTMDMHIKI